jgi:hypothetical protein
MFLFSMPRKSSSETFSSVMVFSIKEDDDLFDSNDNDDLFSLSSYLVLNVNLASIIDYLKWWIKNW